MGKCISFIVRYKGWEVPAQIAPYLMSKTSTRVAKRLFLMAENFSANEARSIGLINEVVDNLTEAHQLIKDICAQVTKCGPEAVQSSKGLIHGVLGQPHTEDLIVYVSLMHNKVARNSEAMLGSHAKKLHKPMP